MRNEENESTSHLVPQSGSEFDLIERIKRRALAHRKAPTHIPDQSLLVGIGDDAAVIAQRSGRETVITSDLLVEDIDFKLSTTTPSLLGHKALAVSLSDIAAMGALPRYALLAIGIPETAWRSGFVDEFYEGFFGLARTYDVALIGGDISRTPERIVIDSIVLADVAQGCAVRRSSARPGDHIFVTGSLGGASAGLLLLEKGASLREDTPDAKSDGTVEQLLLRQLRPEPRVPWGLALNKDRLATAMIDISDGLSSDLAHLCHESNVGAFLDASRIPVESSVLEVCERLEVDPLRLALDGGEDFELLFTVRPGDLKRLPSEIGGVPVTYIGDVTNEAGQVFISKGTNVETLEPGGFTHFKHED